MPIPNPPTFFILALTLLAIPATADWPAYANRDDVCLVVHELESGREYVSNSERCNEPRRPYSTFKIPNALLGLETGLLADADSVMRYNAARYPAEDWWPASWDRDQPLRRAINISAVPLFRQLAADIGPARMQAFLRDIDYGNADIGGEADAFWLTGDLRISALEQVEFLTRLATGRGGVGGVGCGDQAGQVVKRIPSRHTPPSWYLIAVKRANELPAGSGSRPGLDMYTQDGENFPWCHTIYGTSLDRSAAIERSERVLIGIPMISNA